MNTVEYIDVDTIWPQKGHVIGTWEKMCLDETTRYSYVSAFPVSGLTILSFASRYYYKPVAIHTVRPHVRYRDTRNNLERYICVRRKEKNRTPRSRWYTRLQISQYYCRSVNRSSCQDFIIRLETDDAILDTRARKRCVLLSQLSIVKKQRTIIPIAK